MSFAERYGPWAVVTGASEGTGREFARQIAAQSVPSILVARRAEPLAALAGEIREEFGVECVTASVDLSAPDAAERIADAVGTREVGLFVNACYGGLRGMAAYTASKAFMLCFTEALWGELQPKGVDALTIVMGQTDTPAYRKLLAEKRMPLPTAWASPADVARVGLERLPHGPVHNWGLADEEVGYAITSAATRRARVLAIGA